MSPLDAVALRHAGQAEAEAFEAWLAGVPMSWLALCEVA